MTDAINAGIKALNRLGQSVWYDNLSRDVLRKGELKALIEAGVSGLTSNPTIFKKAIADSSDYDRAILELAERRGYTIEQICEELMIQDVAAAADLLRGVYDATSGADGFASIEVSPFLARDAAASIKAAERLWGKLNRPNIMIKIPGTPEGLPAIKHCLAAGINVNITLLFSTANYERVIEAYLSALEERAASKRPLGNVASVASFFVSRVDAICEERIKAKVQAGQAGERSQKLLFGKVGIANALLAYQSFEKYLSSARFKALYAMGARLQRPLWASTGTKNPALDPLLYVAGLAGENTVNTMPPATLKSLMQSTHSFERQLPGDVNAAVKIIEEVDRLGLNFAALMQELQEVGVKLFADSYRELLQAIEHKLRALAGKAEFSQP